MLALLDIVPPQGCEAILILINLSDTVYLVKTTSRF